MGWYPRFGPPASIRSRRSGTNDQARRDTHARAEARTHVVIGYGARALYIRRMTRVDILAIAAHRDDIELTCGGTLIKARKQGHRTAVLDLTAGEMGTRGSADLRAAEAAQAAEILGVDARENLGFPDAGITNTPATRATLAVAIRRFTPRVVIAPATQGRHPDHRVTAELVRDACFVAGLAKIEPSIPKHRPLKVVHCVTYREDFAKPTFVVDITDELEQKLDAIRCYGSQFDGAIQAGEVFPNGDSLYEVVRQRAAHYGSFIRRRYGEPFITAETMRVDDLMSLEVSTF
ncbi:MAG: bacillithiol biosynthesis deacetylase BshB1 [Gemmatimonadaceae bacterium]